MKSRDEATVVMARLERRRGATAASYHASCSTLPDDAPPWPVHRQDAPMPQKRREAVLDCLRAMRKPGESYSDVILRLAKAESRKPQAR
jgi:hypothetical protein